MDRPQPFRLPLLRARKSRTKVGTLRIDQGANLPNSGNIRTAPLASLLEQVARALHSAGHSQGLFPAQWVALRYFSTVEPRRATAIQLARFQGIAFGPVSRTVRTLIEKELLIKAGSAGKGRGEVIAITPAGRVMLEKDPLKTVQDALETLSLQEREILAQTLQNVIYAVQGGSRDPLSSG